MKRLSTLCGLISLICALSFQTITACTITIEPLRKHFRRANAVFLAEAIEIKPRSPPDPRAFISDDITFNITESWKGNYRNRVTLPASSGFMCGCDRKPSRFETGKKYVVFLRNDKVADICDSDLAENSKTSEAIRQLDSFWFRTWARIYPF